MVAAKHFKDLERPLKEEDFWALPDDEHRYEIILGELFVAPPPSFRHQDISAEIAGHVRDVIRPMKLGKVVTAPVGLRLADTTIVQPDLMFVSLERRGIVQGIRVVGTPDLIMEALSSNRSYDLVKKRETYRTLGVPEYWIVDPKNELIEVLGLVEGQYEQIPVIDGIAASAVLPGPRIDIAELFASIW